MFRILLAAASLFAQDPQYAGKAVLKFPEGYRDWYFVGSNLGIGYSPEPTREQFFKNMYVQKSAADAFRRTGKFPEKTMIVMEIYKPETKASPATSGHFQGAYTGIEVAVKDSGAVKEGWAYYKFFDEPGKNTSTAKAFGKAACWDCHNKHGAADNVFVQFYPRLRDKN